MDKRTYESPKLVDLGTVADLTLTGLTTVSSDGKSGSVLHSRGR